MFKLVMCDDYILCNKRYADNQLLNQSDNFDKKIICPFNFKCPLLYEYNKYNTLY